MGGFVENAIRPERTDQVWPGDVYEKGCRLCPRLAGFRDHNQEKYPLHFNRPVPPFGDKDARLLVVGLAPGLHGANRTGRPFTGDYCGPLLYSTLRKHGFALKDDSTAIRDGQALIDCRVTNSVKCVPPENKPLPAEIRQCNAYLQNELSGYAPQAILALGVVAHQAVLIALGIKQSAYRFKHGAQHDLGQRQLFDSYHVSRYNTSTGRLTVAMFDAVVAKLERHLSLA
ncbi:MAG: uracil-DNA glycosylase [Burkholderiaceae bacterium]